MWQKPRQVMMTTRCANVSRTAARFPFAESLFQDARVQPYIHSCFVTVYEGRHIYRFCIFFKRHCRLPPNLLLGGTENDFRGDAVVMRVGADHQLVVNMRGRDVSIADYMMVR